MEGSGPPISAAESAFDPDDSRARRAPEISKPLKLSHACRAPREGSSEMSEHESRVQVERRDLLLPQPPSASERHRPAARQHVRELS